uniref:Uncharacterized protein n=1 Tax=Rhizophora mucronata TaxID=61149 RepID=A0A2P2P303_RHIMU
MEESLLLRVQWEKKKREGKWESRGMPNLQIHVCFVLCMNIIWLVNRCLS